MIVAASAWTSQKYSQKLTWTPEPLCGSPAGHFHPHSNEPRNTYGNI